MSLNELSPREREATRLVATGAGVKAAAAELGVVTKTVEIHLYRAQKKLGLRNRRALIELAQRLIVTGRPHPREPRARAA